MSRLSTMTAKSPDTFATLLTQGVQSICRCEGRTMQAVQDELGYALGLEGGAMIIHWRKGGSLPTKPTYIAELARIIVRRGNLDRTWLEAFVARAQYPYPAHLYEELFPIRLNRHSIDEHPLPNAPFITGVPITHPQRFFGREYELRWIFDSWQHLPLQNVTIVGPRRSGKTSLLYYLKRITTIPPSELRPDQRKDWLPSQESYQWAFVDFQDPRMCHQERLLQYLLSNLKLPIPTPCTLLTFIDVIVEHLRTPAIILMDEIGAALESPELDQRFWWSLRALGTTQTEGKLGFVLSAPQLPADLARAYEKPSPFFNIFGYICTLGPLTEAEARTLIASSPLPFLSEEIDWIVTQSHCWPLLVQILCRVRLITLKNGETGHNWQIEGLRQIAPFQHLLTDITGNNAL